MIVAVVGSRCLPSLNIAPHIPDGTSRIISGGARGVDEYAAAYARMRSIELVEIKPDYRKHGRGAPLRRNDAIVAAADLVVAFWDGKSRGTRYIIDRCRKVGKECRIVLC